MKTTETKAHILKWHQKIDSNLFRGKKDKRIPLTDKIYISSFSKKKVKL